jgi:hypothetical protein
VDLDRIELGPDAVVFRRYPYPGSRVHPAGAIPWAEVVEVDPEAAPPELRTEGETLFVSAVLKDDLRREAEAHGVPILARVDMWDLLLEPFLDTSFNQDDQERTLSLLEKNGMPRDQALVIREEVRERMLEYNSVFWDRVHLGMCDLLDAHRPVLDERRFRDFYAWAQEIARRAGVRKPWRPPAGDDGSA